MTEKALNLSNRMLWPLSIAAGLILHVLLASFLWNICTSFDDTRPLTLRLIKLSLPVVEARPPEDPVIATTEALVAEPRPLVEPEPIVEPVAVEPEPVVETEPVVAEPIQPLPKVIKEEVKPRPEPVAKPVKKPKTQVKPAVTPVAAEVKAAPIASPAPPTRIEQVIKPRVQTTASPVATAAVPAAPARDFSSYLQKIYQQLERNKKYPTSARRRSITGKVTVAFSINSEGKAVEATVISRSPRELSEAALKLVASQRFVSPPDGWNSASRIEMQINYSLR
ncbi:MAG: hypothetical protein CVV42_06850 [Candidatus Riflebacteria bacterium HGW-Riflebacteria-2]|jgi:protein TonB|nr:MAG: hypothetical protein CVV42_06850 [Candidatus Riflebacteria bacterium HGW-Riflebacteria-2]